MKGKRAYSVGIMESKPHQTLARHCYMDNNNCVYRLSPVAERQTTDCCSFAWTGYKYWHATWFIDCQASALW